MNTELEYKLISAEGVAHFNSAVNKLTKDGRIMNGPFQMVYDHEKKEIFYSQQFHKITSKKDS